MNICGSKANSAEMIDGASEISRDTLMRKSIFISRLLCIASALFPLAAGIGWISNIPVFTQIIPSLPAMQPNTIVGLILSAVYILISTYGLSLAQLQGISVLGILVSALGLITLGEYALGLNSGIDRIFVREGVDYLQAFPGRPSPQAAANFALLGFSLILHAWRGKIHIYQICTLFVIANSTFALTGYIFSTERYFGFPAPESTVGIALHTGIAFVLLSVSILYSRPDEGLMQLLTSNTGSGCIARRVSLICILAPPIIGILTRLGVIGDWYNTNTQASLFAVVLFGLFLWATWYLLNQAEKDELLAKKTFEEVRFANEKLRLALDEREIFSAFLENSDDFIGIADPSGKPIYVNPAGRRMVGLTSEVVIQETEIPEYYSAEQRVFAQEVILKVMLEKGRWNGETYFRNWTTGESIPVSDEHFMIRNKESGRVLGMGTISRDITQIRKVQKSLEQSERKFRSIFDNSMDAVLLISPDGKIAMANHSATVMFGFSEDDLKKLGQQAVVDSADSRLAKAIGERSKTGRFRGEMMMKRKDQTLFSVEVSFSVFKDEHGFEWTSMFIRDITDRKKAEHEREMLLRQIDHEKRWLEAVFEGAPIGMVMVRAQDSEHPIPNVHARKIFGSHIDWKVGRASYIGQACDAKSRPLSKEELISSRVLRGETIIGEEQLLKFTDGRDFPIVAAGGPIKDENGKQIGGVAFFQDISSLKELERLREEWAAIIAHDFRQPIAAIQMQANLLRILPEINGRGKKFAEMIESSAKQLNRMTFDLLEVSQLDANKLNLDFEIVDLFKLIQDIIEKLKPLYPNNEIKLKINGPIENIHADPGRIEQVIGNLISNASKYGYSNTDISLELSQSDSWVEIAITNYGKGIEPSEIGRLFQRFQRTQLGKVEGIKGIGLGLYITRGLIEAHGGSIRIESFPGKTTTFKIKLPVGDLRPGVAIH